MRTCEKMPIEVPAALSTRVRFLKVWGHPTRSEVCGVGDVARVSRRIADLLLKDGTAEELPDCDCVAAGCPNGSTEGGFRDDLCLPCAGYVTSNRMNRYLTRAEWGKRTFEESEDPMFEVGEER